MELTFDAKYAAISGRDARFDGVFYTAVASTKIFCRPSCPARTPSKSGVCFYDTAAAAIAASYRPCRRCRPDEAPGTTSMLQTVTSRTLALIDEGVLDREGIDAVAARVGYSVRSLHRHLTEETGASPADHARGRRARAAADLLRHTNLRCADVAFAAGFASVRQFNDTMRAVYNCTPTALRQAGGRRTSTLSARLGYRTPFDFDGLLAWFAPRALAGVERVTESSYSRALMLPRGPGVLTVTNDAARSQLVAEFRLADSRDHAPAVAVVRRLFDLDADPHAIDAALSADPVFAELVAARPGMRLPGVVGLDEVLLRAVVGQQITVASAIAMLSRLAAFGQQVDDTWRLVPAPESAADHVDQWFAGPASRRDTIVRALAAVPDLAASDNFDADLLAIKGIGPWTAAYVQMRWRQHPDVWPRGDVALIAAARELGLPASQSELAAYVEGLSPWRSYAALHLWHHLLRKDTHA